MKDRQIPLFLFIIFVRQKYSLPFKCILPHSLFQQRDLIIIAPNFCSANGASRIRKFIRVIRNGDVFSGWKQGRFFFSRGKHCRDSRRSAGRKIRLENFLPRHVTLQVRVKRWKFQEKKKKKKVNQSNSYRRRKIPELSVNCWLPNRKIFWNEGDELFCLE